MTVPCALIGAWRRVGLLVDGVRQADVSDALWLQTADWFADIRLRIDPLAPPPDRALGFWRDTAFAGTARWEPPRFTWEHVLDAKPSASVDSSPLSWEDGVLAEHLTVSVGGRDVAVVEEWLRMADDTVPSEVTVGDRNVKIRLGLWAIDVCDRRPDGPFVATRSKKGPKGWLPVGSVTVAASRRGAVAASRRGTSRVGGGHG